MAREADFLVEIGTEELPPKALPVLERAFADHLGAALRDNGLGGQTIESFATPRRLAVRVGKIRLTQPDREVEKRGPPVSAAFGRMASDEAATAFAGWARRRGARGGETRKGAWLAYRGVEASQAAATLLPAMVEGGTGGAARTQTDARWGAGDAESCGPCTGS